MPKTVVSLVSFLPSAVPRATQDHAPGRGKADSESCAVESPGPGTMTEPATEPSDLTVPLSAQRISP